MRSIPPASAHGWVIWPSPARAGAWERLIPALCRVGWASSMINAFGFKADTSQIITYRCAKAFMWERQMRLLLSDSGAAEDRKPRPGTRQGLERRRSPKERGSERNRSPRGPACLRRLGRHLQPIQSSLGSGTITYSRYTSQDRLLLNAFTSVPAY